MFTFTSFKLVSTYQVSVFIRIILKSSIFILFEIISFIKMFIQPSEMNARLIYEFKLEPNTTQISTAFGEDALKQK